MTGGWHGGGTRGVHEEITDYVNVGRVSKQIICFTLEAQYALCFQTNVLIKNSSRYPYPQYNFQKVDLVEL